MTLKEIAKEIETPVSSLQRIFDTLVYVGVLEKKICPHCDSHRGFGRGDKADKYMAAWT